MRYSSLFSPALALALASSAFASDAPSDVLSLTSTDFDNTVNPEPLILVEFFAPWYAFHSNIIGIVVLIVVLA